MRGFDTKQNHATQIKMFLRNGFVSDQMVWDAKKEDDLTADLIRKLSVKGSFASELDERSLRYNDHWNQSSRKLLLQSEP